MLTRRIDAALDAIAACRDRIPALRDLYRDGSWERAALDDLIAAARRANGLLTDQHPRPSGLRRRGGIQGPRGVHGPERGARGGEPVT